MKRVLSLILSIIMLLSVFPAEVFAGDGETDATAAESAQQLSPVPVSAVEILTEEEKDRDSHPDSEGIDLTVGEKRQLYARIVPENASCAAVRWESTDAAVLIVDENGCAQALQVGTCKIRAVAGDESGVFAEREITVTASAEETGESAESGEAAMFAVTTETEESTALAETVETEESTAPAETVETEESTAPAEAVKSEERTEPAEPVETEKITGKESTAESAASAENGTSAVPEEPGETGQTIESASGTEPVNTEESEADKEQLEENKTDAGDVPDANSMADVTEKPSENAETAENMENTGDGESTETEDKPAAAEEKDKTQEAGTEETSEPATEKNGTTEESVETEESSEGEAPSEDEQSNTGDASGADDSPDAEKKSAENGDASENREASENGETGDSATEKIGDGLENSIKREDAITVTLLERLFGKEEDEEEPQCLHEFGEDGICELCGITEEAYQQAIKEKQDSCNHVFSEEGYCPICLITLEEYEEEIQARCSHEFGEDGVCTLCGLTEEAYLEKQVSCAHEFGEDGVCTLCRLTIEAYREKQRNCAHEFGEDSVCPLCGITEAGLLEWRDNCAHEFDENRVCTLCGITEADYIVRLQELCSHEFGEDGICLHCGLTREQYEYDHRFHQNQIVDGVRISVEAPYGVFPEGAVLECAKIEDAQVSFAVDEAIDPLRESGRRVNSSYRFDIRIMLDGVEIEPDTAFGEVKVNFSIEQKLTDAASVDVYHVTTGDDNATLYAEKVDSAVGSLADLPADTEETENGTGSFTDGTGVSIAAESFSYYVVEFTYNDRLYVMQGGTVVPISEVLRFFDIPLGEITDVSVSNEELLYAAYLENLTEGGGEWTLISLQSFNTEEWLKITVDGTTYEIALTDAVTKYGLQLINQSSYTSTFEMGISGESSTYYVTQDTTITVGETQAAMKIRDGSGPVVLYIPEGKTLTVTGGNAKGTVGGGPGIYVPQGKTLIIVGGGTLIAKGGAPAAGTNGDRGHNGSAKFDVSCGNVKKIHVRLGTGGAGGAGGGGGGAGIGTFGGKGGAGGKGGFYDDLNPDEKDKVTWSDSIYDGVTTRYFTYEKYFYQRGGRWGKDGESGGDAESCGTVLWHNVNLTGVKAQPYSSTLDAAPGGTSGTTQGSGGYDHEGDYSQAAGGGGTGGGGLGGKKGADIGTGGPGGGGGGGGGTGGLRFVGSNQDAGGNGGTANNGTGEVIYNSWNDSNYGGSGGSLGGYGSDAVSKKTDDLDYKKTAPEEVKRTFVIENTSYTISFKFDGTAYPNLRTDQYPADSGTGESAFNGYYYEVDGVRHYIYNSCGVWTGELIEPLNADINTGTFQLKAETLNGIKADIPRTVTVTFEDGTSENRQYNEHYTSVQKAVDAAKNGETVRLRCDNVLDLPVTVSADKAISIDLHGFNLKNLNSACQDTALIVNNGTLSLKGPGSIRNTGSGKRVAVRNNSSLSVTGWDAAPSWCTDDRIVLYAYGDSNQGIGIESTCNLSVVTDKAQITGFGHSLGIGIMYTSGGTMSLQNGKINGGSSGNYECAPIGIQNGELTVDAGSVANAVLSSGAVEGCGYEAQGATAMAAFYVGSGGTLNITGGSWTGRTYGIVNKGYRVSVSGGTVTGSGVTEGSGSTAGYAVYNLSGSLNITGGKFIGNGARASAVNLARGTENCNISGGFFVSKGTEKKQSIQVYEDYNKPCVTGGYFSDNLSSGVAVYDKSNYGCEPDESGTDQDCPYKLYKLADVEVAKAESGTYNGKAVNGFVYDSEAYALRSKVYYQGEGSTRKELGGDAPVNAGRYSVDLKFLKRSGDQLIKQTVVFDINRRPVKITLADQQVTFGTLVTLSPEIETEDTASGILTDYSATADISFTKDGKEIVKPEELGTYQYLFKKLHVKDASGSETDTGGRSYAENYEPSLNYPAGSTGKVEIVALPLKFGTSPKGYDVQPVYNSSSQPLLSVYGTPDGNGVVKYCVLTEQREPNLTEYTLTDARATDAGTYYVYARVMPVEGSTGYRPSDSVCVTAVIRKATAEFSITPASGLKVSFTRTGALVKKNFASDVTFTGVTVHGSITRENEEPVTFDVSTKDEFAQKFIGKYAGNYHYVLEAEPNKNYEFPAGNGTAENGKRTISDDITINHTVLPSTNVTTLNCSNITYGNSVQDSDLQYTFKNKKYDGKLIEGNGTIVLDGESGPVTRAGKVNVKFVPSGDYTKIFKETPMQVTITDSQILPRTVEIAWSGTVFSYDGKPHVPTAVISNLIEGDSCTPVVEVDGYTDSLPSAIGTYIARVTGLQSGPNERYTLNGQTFTQEFYIADIDDTLIVAPEVYAKVDGLTHSIELMNVPVVAEIWYSDDSTHEAYAEKTWRSENYAYSAEGRYQVYFKVQYQGIPAGQSTPTTITKYGKSSVNLYTDETSYTFTKEPQLQNRTYDGSNQSFVEIYPEVSAGKVQYAVCNAASFSGDIQQFVFSDNLPAAKDAGDYYVAYRIADQNGNPRTTAQAVYVKIEPMPVTVSWTGTRLTYNGELQAPTASASETIPDSLKVTGSGRNAGTYSAYVRAVDSETPSTDRSANYSFTNSSCTFTIEKAQVSNVVVPSALSEPAVTDPETPVQLVNAGSATGGRFQYAVKAPGEEAFSAYSYNIPTASDRGSYTIKYQLVPDSNHTSDDTAEHELTQVVKHYAVPADPVAASDLSYRYDKTAKTGLEQKLIAEIQGTCTGGTMSYRVDGGEWTPNFNAVTAIEPGEYTISYKAVAQQDDYYVDSEVYTLPVITIDKQEITLSTVTAEKVYDSSTYIEYTYVPDVEYCGCTIKVQGQTQSPNATPAGQTAPMVEGSAVYIAYAEDLNRYELNLAASMTVNAVITQKPVTVSWDSVTVFTYDGKAHAPAASAEGRIAGDSCEVTVSGQQTNANAVDGKVIAGKSNYTASVTGLSNSNYKISETQTPSTCNFLINKAAGTYTPPVAKTGLKYNGQPQTLVEPAVSGDGTFRYSVDTGELGTELPTAADFGEHSVSWQFIGDENHLDGEMQTGLTVTIDKGTPAVTTAPAAIQNRVYNGSDQTLVTAGTAENGTVRYHLGGETAPGTDDETAWSVTPPSAANAGTYNVWWYIKGNNGYYDTRAELITVKIAKADVTVITAPSAVSGLVYAATEQNLAVPGTVGEGHGTVLYALSWNGEYSDTVPVAKNAGRYRVWWYVQGTANYNDTAKKSFSVSIAAKPAALIWKDTEQTYTGSTILPTAILYNVCTGDDCRATVSCAEPSVNAGTYTAKATLTGSAAANYSAPDNMTCTFTVKKAVAAASALPQIKSGLVYNGSQQEVMTPGTTDDGTMMYSTDGYSWSSFAAAGKESDSYSIYWYIDGDANHTDSLISKLSAEAVIEPKEVTLAWVDYDNLTYCGSVLCPKATAQGLCGNDACNVTVTGGAIDAGEHTATAVSIDNANYKLPADSTRSFTIQKAYPEYTAPLPAENLVYTGSPIVLIVPGSTEHGKLQYSLTGSSGDWHDTVDTITGTDAGDYVIYGQLLGDRNHLDYTQDSEGNIPHGTVTVTKATAVLTKAPQTVKGLVYTGEPQTLVTPGKSNTGIVEYSLDNEIWSTNLPQATNAGSYTVYCRAGGDGNHEPSESISISGAVIAKARPATGTPAAAPITYGEALQKSTITCFDAAGTYAWEYPDFVPDKAETTDFDAIFTPTDTENYLVTEVEVNLTVNPRPVGISWPQAREDGTIRFVYNGKPQIPVAEATGLLTGDTCTLTVKGSDSTLPGDYTARVTDLSNNNYALPADPVRSYAIVEAEMKNVFASDVNVVFDGKWHGIEVRNTPDGSTVQYSTDDGVTYSKDRPMFLKICSAQSVLYRVTCPGYKNFEGSAKVTITENPIFTELPEGKENLIYNGTAQQLCTTGTVSSPSSTTVSFSLDHENWSTEVPTAEHAGEYRIYYMAERTLGMVTETENGVLLVEIAGKPVTITWKNTVFDYDGTAKCPTAALNGLLEKDSSVQPVVTGAEVNAGTHTAKVTGLSGTDYVLSGSTAVSYTINKVKAELTHPTALAEVVADGTEKEIILPGSSAHGELQYASLTVSGLWSEETPRVTMPGKYTVRYRLACDGNHYDNNVYTLEAKLYYGSAKASHNPTAIDLTYTGTPQTLCTEAVTGEGTVQYSLNNIDWSTSVPTGTGAGSYTVYWRILGDELHLDSPVYTVSAQIEKAPCRIISCPAAISGLVYNGNRQILVTAGRAEGGELCYATDTAQQSDSDGQSGDVGEDSKDDSREHQRTSDMTDSSSGNYTANISGNYSTELPTAINAGDHPVNWYVRGDENHQDSEVATVMTTIAKAVYTDKGNYYASPLTYGETLSESAIINVKGGNMTWKTPNYVPASAGVHSYTAVFTPEDSANYLSEELEVSLTVKKKTVYLKWDESTIELPYNGEQQAPEAEVQGLVGSDVCTVTVEGGQVNVGTYTATATALSNSNYKLGPAGTQCIFSIVPAKMHVHADDVLVQYSGEDPNRYSITVTGMPEGSAVYYSMDGINYSETNPSFTGKAGEDVNERVYYAVYCENYELTFGSARVLIYGGIIASFTTNPAAVQNLVYSGELLELVTAGTVANPDTMKAQYMIDGLDGAVFSDALPEMTNAGKYTVLYKAVSTQTGDIPIGQRVHESQVFSVEVTVSPKETDVTWQKSATDPSGTLTYTYDGAAHLPYAYGTDLSGAVMEASVTCSNGQAVTAGDYTAAAVSFNIDHPNYAVSSGTGTTAFTIAKAAVDNITHPVARTGLIYNGSYQSLANPGSSTQGTMLYGLSYNGNKDGFTETVPQVTDAGTYTLYYYVKGDSNHLDSDVYHIDCVIAPVASAVVMPPAPLTGLTYTGSPQVLVSAGTASNGTVVYSLTGAADSFSGAIPTGTDAGSYTVYYKVEGSRPNYADTEVKAVTATIARAVCDVTAPAAVENLKYTGKSLTLLTPGSSAHGTVKYSLDGFAWTDDVNAVTGVDAGNYKVLYYAQGRENYSDSPVYSISVYVDYGDPGYMGSITATSITYGESLEKSILSGAVDGEVYWLDETYVPANAGNEAYAAVWFPDNENLCPAFMTVNVKTRPRTAQIEWGEENLTYTGEELVRTATVTNLLDGDSCAVTVDGAKVNPGKYEAKITGLSNSNYALPDTDLTASFTVTGGAVMKDVYALDVSGVADGTTKYHISVCNVPMYAKVFYSTDGSDYSETNPEYSETGTWTVRYKVQCEGYVDFLSEATISISSPAAPVFTVTAPQGKADLTYNGEKQTLALPGSAVCEISGTEREAVMLYALMNNGTANYSTSVPAAEEAGNYVIAYCAWDPETNTFSTVSSITVEIAKKELELAWSGLSWVYDEKEHIPTAAASNLCEGDSCAVSVTVTGTPAGIPCDPGTYTACAVSVTNDNYCLGADVQKQYTIEKADPYCIAPQAITGLVYTGAAQTLITSGYALYGSFEYSLDGTAYSGTLPEASAAGKHTVLYRLKENTWYHSLEGTLNVEIAKAPGTVSVKPVPVSGLVYNGQERDLVTAGSSACGDMSYSTDNRVWSTAVPKATSAGEYTVYFRSEESSNYLASETGNVSVAVAKAAPETGTVSAASITYGGTLSASMISVSGGSTPGSVSWKYPAFMPAAGVGSYSAVFTPEDGNNYESSLIEVDLTVQPREVTVSWDATSFSYTGSPVGPAATVDGLIGEDECEANLDAGSRQTAPGSYTAKVTGFSNSNYVLTGPDSVNYTITNGTLTGIYADDVTAEFAPGIGRSITVRGVADGAEITYREGTDGEYSTTNPVITGTAGETVNKTIYYKVSKTNYSDFTGSAKITVIGSEKPALRVTPPQAITGLEYNGALQQLITAGSASRSGSSDSGNVITMQYAIADNGDTGSAAISESEWKDSVNDITAQNAGTYRVLYRVKENNTVVYTGSVDGIVITPLTAEITWYNSSAEESTTLVYEYDGCPHKPYAAVSNLCGSDQIEPKITQSTAGFRPKLFLTAAPAADAVETCNSTVSGSSAEPGPHLAKVVSLSNPNYVLSNNINQVSTTFTVSRAVPSFTAPTANNRTYNGLEEPLINPGTVVDGAGTFLYSITGAADSFSTERPTGTNAGSYIVYYKVKGDTAHSDSPVGTVTAVISKAQATVTVKPQGSANLVYNAAEQKLLASGGTADTSMEYSLDGSNWVKADKINTIAATDAGTYTVRYRASEDSNHYASTPESLTVKISPQPYTFTGSAAATITYGDALGKATVQISGNDNQRGSAQWTDPNLIPDKAGTQTLLATAKFIPTDPNYSSVEIDVTVTVNPRTAQIEWSNTKLDWTGETIAPAAEVANLVGNDICTVTVTGGAVDPGSYTATADSLSNSNYTLSDPKPTTGFSIENKPLTGVTAENVIVVHDGQKHSITVKGAPDGTTITYSTNGADYYEDNPGFTAVGTYTVYYKVDAPGAKTLKSYAIIFIYSAVTPELHITAPTPREITYNGNEQQIASGGSAWYEKSGGRYNMTMLYLLTDDPAKADINNGMTTAVPTARAAGTYYLLYAAADFANGIKSDVYQVPVEIKPAALVLTWSDETEFPYDGEEHAPTVSVRGIYGKDDCPVTVTGKAAAVGEHTARAQISNSNYTLPANASVSFIINKGYADPVVVRNLMYTGKPQNLVEPGIAYKGAMQYSIDGKEWSYLVPAMTDSGTYTVLFRTDISGSPQGSVIGTIAKATAGRVYINNPQQGSYVWQQGNSGSLNFICTTPYSEDVVFAIDGQTVPSRYCILRSGSTIAQVSSSYLNGLSVGEHTYSFSYKNYETSKGEFRVIEKTADSGVRTGDESHSNRYLITMIVSGWLLLIGAAQTFRTGKKKKQFRQ